MFKVEIKGNDQFISALRDSATTLQREAEAASLEAGKRVLLPAVRSSGVPVRSGRLLAGYDLVADGSGGVKWINREPYGAGAELGRRGKWSGFRGSPPRYAGATQDRMATQLAMAIAVVLTPRLGANGWFR